MHYLITGGAGFTGSHLADGLVRSGAGVTILDDFSTGRRENVEQLAASCAAQLVEGSVTDEKLDRRQRAELAIERTAAAVL